MTDEIVLFLLTFSRHSSEQNAIFGRFLLTIGNGDDEQRKKVVSTSNELVDELMIVIFLSLSLSHLSLVLSSYLFICSQTSTHRLSAGGYYQT